MKYDLELVKSAATGQWAHLLPTICGIDPNLLDGKGHPCPNPECPNGPGKDRFSARDLVQGQLFCRHCNYSGTTTMDGFGAIQWLTGYTFPESVAAVGEALGLTPIEPGSTPKRPLIELVAMAKGVRPQELIRYGAKKAIRRDDGADHEVIRFPTYTEIIDGQLIPGCNFDLGIATPLLRKGKAAYGRSTGLFLPSREHEGRNILWGPAPGKKVYLTEGVKDAAKLLELGYVAIGLPSTRLPKELYELFRGMDVYLVPDRDRAGIRGANENGALLWGIAREIRMVHLPSPVKPKDGDGVREIAQRTDGPKLIAAAVETATKWTPEGVGICDNISLYDAAIEFLSTTETGDVPLYTTGIVPLDNALQGGLAQGEIVVMGARPSHGKSAVALQMAISHALRGETCLFVSEEMEPSLLSKRWLSSISEKALSKTDPRELIDLIRTDFADMRRVLITPKLQRIDKIVEAMEQAKQTHGATMCILDYVQLVSDPSARTRYDVVTDVSQKLTQAARRTNMTTIVLAQLNREAEKRGYPMNTDLKESGQLEQDADVILLLWYPCMVPGKEAAQTDFEIHVGKNRNRGLPKQRKLQLDFDGARMTFSDPSARLAAEIADDLFRDMP